MDFTTEKITKLVINDGSNNIILLMTPEDINKLYLTLSEALESNGSIPRVVNVTYVTTNNVASRK